MRWSNSFLALVAISLISGCGDAEKPVGEPTIAWAFHTAGKFEPCGCTAGMHGGLMRRVTLQKRGDAKATLALEGGGWTAGPADHQQLQSAAYLSALVASDIAAIGVGRAEIALGRPILTAHLPQAPIVCANLLAGDGTPLGTGSVTRTVGSRTFTITSVVPADARGADLRAGNPVESLTRLVDQMGNRAAGSTLVVLADLDETALADLARAVPAIDVLIGGDVTAPSQTPVAVGRTRIVHLANHGKALGWYTLGADQCRFELLTEQTPEDPAIRQRVVTLQRTIATADLAADHHVPLAAGDIAYAGPAACAACHPQAAAVHAASPHARALAALTAKGYAADPDCLRCHVTGLSKPDGWFRRDTRAELAAVTCESCHGPGAAHVAAGGKVPLIPASPATCVGCHDSDNSPHFNYGAYWAKIAHQ